MDEEIKSYSSFQEFTEALLEKSKGVFSVFCEVFGEDMCDVQIDGSQYDRLEYAWERLNTSVRDRNLENILTVSKLFNIIVYFPEFEIRNEFDEHHIIKELYVNVGIDINGKYSGDLDILRTRYTHNEIYSGYKHSHCHKIQNTYDFGFNACCIGSGPIRSTLAELLRECDLDRWNIFCFQLEQYVSTESVAGGPYIRMNTIGMKIDRSSSIKYTWENIYKGMGKEILYPWIVSKFLLTTPITFVNRDGVLIPDMTAVEFVIRLSEGAPGNICNHGVLIGDTLYPYIIPKFKEESYSTLAGMFLLSFKGEPKYLRIDDPEPEKATAGCDITMIKSGYIYPVIEVILMYLNILSYENTPYTHTRVKSIT